MDFALILRAIGLIFSVLQEVHAVQAALPGAPGADKSQAVIDKVAPVATALGAEVPHIQSLIDSAVGIFKAVGAFKGPAADPNPGA